jgi:uncharacterized protein YndB with AHSA1/START domain
MAALADATESIDRTLTITRSFPVERSKVFHAFVDRDAFARWVGSKGMKVVECDQSVVKGGRFRALLQDEAGESHVLTGEFREVCPEDRLVFSWEPQWGKEKGAPTIVTIELRDKDGSTELALTQSVFSTLDARDRHARYWEGCLDSLQAYLG